MTTDIFIKTYHKDFIWLEWCLKSIKQFSHGFNKVIIVSDNDGNKLPNNLLTILPVTVFYVDLPKTKPTKVTHGLGYLWQQYIKLSWYKYSKADEVLVLDSDEMLTMPTCPANFKTNNKYHWFYRNWEEMGDAKCWRESTEKLLGCKTENSGMCITGFVLQKETSVALKNHLCNLFNAKDIWEIFVNNNMETASEFNIYGCFVQKYDRKEYKQIDVTPDLTCFNLTIKKDWSWGGLDDVKIMQRKSVLKRRKMKCLLSFRRSGRHLFEKLFNRINYKCCNCSTTEVWRDKCYNEHAGRFHLKHECNDYTDLHLFGKVVVLYRKDIVEQIDACLRLDIEEAKKATPLTLEEHNNCNDTSFAYELYTEKIKGYYIGYNKFVKQIIQSDRDDMLVIEYDRFVQHPEDTIKNILLFLDYPIGKTTITNMIKDEIIEYKHSISVQRYNELKTILDSFKGTIDTKEK
jgi:hypothetical protein